MKIPIQELPAYLKKRFGGARPLAEALSISVTAAYKLIDPSKPGKPSPEHLERIGGAYFAEFVAVSEPEE